MQGNIKDTIKKDFKETNYELSKNHRTNFENKLKKELHQTNKNKFTIIKIAASIIFLISIVVFTTKKTSNKNNAIENYSLGSLSPELEKIENYYTNAISYELTQLEINDENKPVLDKYLNKLGQLTKQYNEESTQLNIDEINEKTINSLIDNLQLRLQLLLQLKEQLNIIKNKKDEKHKL